MADGKEAPPHGDKLERRENGERRLGDDRRAEYERRLEADRRTVPPEAWNDALFTPDMDEATSVKARSFLDRRDAGSRRTGYSRRDGVKRRDE